MSRWFLAGATVLSCGACFLLCLLAADEATPALAAGGQERSGAGGKRPSGDDVFGATRVWGIHLDIPATEYAPMQPAPGGFGFPGAPPKAPAPKKKDSRDGEQNLFGTLFPWAQADCTVAGKTYKKVGVRYSGEITYFASSQGLKRPLTLAF